MNTRNVIALLTSVGVVLASSHSYASCKVEFPNGGFRCIEEGGTKDAIGFGVFVGPQPDLVLHVGVQNLAAPLFGSCIIPLDITGNEIRECAVCVGPGGVDEATCEANVFPVDLSLGTS